MVRCSEQSMVPGFLEMVMNTDRTHAACGPFFGLQDLVTEAAQGMCYTWVVSFSGRSSPPAASMDFWKGIISCPFTECVLPVVSGRVVLVQLIL